MGIKNIIFIHVPKTAGVAIGHGFARDGHLKDGFRNNHSTAQQRKKQKNLKWDEDTIVLGVIRNPYDRLWSVYEFYSKKLRSISLKLSFTDFILTFEEKFHPKGEQFNTCYNYLTGEDGKFLTTDIIRFENLEKEYDDFCQKYNIKNTLRHDNKNDKKGTPPEYTEEMREVVEKIFRKDLDTFNYSYDDYLRSIK